MAAFILDASVASTWCFKEESTDYTNAVLDTVSGSATAAAPRLWLYEVHNTTLIGLRRQRISQEDADAFLSLLSDLSIQITDPLSYNAVFTLAQRHNLTVYDAAYLDLALRECLPLASLDGALCRAAGKSGVSLFRP